MSSTARRRERREQQDIEEERRRRDYDKKVADHPVTDLLASLNYDDAPSFIEAVRYLLERARDDDVGAP